MSEDIYRSLDGKAVLVTGGTGSFGRNLVRTLLDHGNLKRLVIFSRDELKHYRMQQAFPPDKYPALRYFVGDVRDQNRLEFAMRNVDVVLHAAAMKHVPIAEYNPFECVRTNIHGAENVVRAAINTGVSRVIALSTDKAANPINLYGATKLASDKIFVAGNNMAGSDGPRFAVVRYGNVIGSSGSVVPFFRQQIADGATSLPITDERMTRFWITLPQAVRFVLSCFQMMRGGEIYVPKIPSMSVPDLARAMAPDLPHRVIGIRPGEKLHEVMVTVDSARHTLELDDRYIIQPDFDFWESAPYHAAGAKPVAEDFEYASDTNDQWLDETQLKQLLAQLD